MRINPVNTLVEVFIALHYSDLQKYLQTRIMNVAIVGCGYVGNKIARHLSYAFGCNITVIALSKEEVPKIKIASSQEAAIITSGDEASLFSVLNNQDAVILSFPTISSVRQSHTFSDRTSGDEHTYLDTAKNLAKILKLKQKLKQNVKQLIFVSSCAVYGGTNGQWVNEDSPIAATNLKNDIISQIENILLQASCGDLKVCILRLGEVYGLNYGLYRGLNHPLNHGLSQQLKDYSSCCGKTLSGTGEEFINFTHIDDIASVTGFIIQNKLQGIYNLVNDLPMKSGEFFQTVCKSEGFANVEWDSSINTNLHNVRVSNQKLKLVGYRFIHSRFSV